MLALMYQTSHPVRADLAHKHLEAWRLIARPGAFFDASERVQIVHEARAALDCALCRRRQDALSPNAVDGAHDTVSALPAPLVDLIHRIRTDPARMTRSVFDGVVAAGISAERYVEAVSVVCTSVIVDTFHNALGLPVPDTLPPEPGPPTGQEPPRVVDAGAWVPLTSVEEGDGVFGMPRAPNIGRAMGLVPGAVTLFFLAFRAHYALRDIPLDISQAQAEFIASRVSALNECFY